MKLSDYLAAHDLSDLEFASVMGCDRTTVLRWRNERVMPEPKQIKRIAEITNGAVTANDFYGIARSPPDPEAPQTGDRGAMN